MSEPSSSNSADGSSTQSSNVQSTSNTTPNTPKGKAIVGICAMARKANGKPMLAILEKMRELYGDYLETLTFDEDTILNEHPTKWPHCHCLISFYSQGFPMEKAIEYARVRRPYIINDLHRQYDLQDRIKVYKMLARHHIDQPRHVVLNRNADKAAVDELVEHPDSIEVNGVIINKPFVEKPVSAEDHNVHIYFPSSVGGGSQRLFRKVNNRSSQYSPEGNVRREGSYIYEEFIAAGGTDVKVYAVGPFYAHAEARKSPALDGKVDRDSKGKEVRYPVMLTSREKSFARRIVLAFGQTVCGFDLLRAGGKSYVVDVNGFSFVKTSTKYYEDTARILGNMILKKLAYPLNLPWRVPYQQEDPPVVASQSGKMMELRCVLAVIRHGDRTPKQKIKMPVNDKRFFKLFKEEGGPGSKGQLKMKKPKQLARVLELTREILGELREKQRTLKEPTDHSSDDDEFTSLQRQINKFEQVRAVLEMYGYFSGINRKVQLKYYHQEKESKTSAQKPVESDSDEEDATAVEPLNQSTNSKTEGIPESDSLLLIVKWGGELTPAGVMQAEALGKLFRTLYPGLRGGTRDEDKRGLGFLRLHSTYRHDLKIYASDEGRVQLTAAAFTRGLLALEGELAPILTSMVKSANMNGLLDDDWSARKHQNEVKTALHVWLQSDRDLGPADVLELNPTGRKSIKDALEFIKNPRKMCDEIYGYIGELHNVLVVGKQKYPESQLYLQETWDLAEARWGKLLKDFRRSKKGGEIMYDISKIPDIYDNIKYDMEHNPDLAIHYEDDFERLYMCVKNMADVLVPLEYGIKVSAKLAVAQGVCTHLMKKILGDLKRCIEPENDDELTARLDPRASEGISTPLRHVRTRLYFTSESHIHTLMNLIKYGGLEIDASDHKWQRAMQFLSSVTEYNYMTQLVIMLYEDVEHDPLKQAELARSNDTKRFHIELLFSPGLYPCFQTEKERIYEGNMGLDSPDRILSDTFEPPRATSVNKPDKVKLEDAESRRRAASKMRAASFSMDSSEDDKMSRHGSIVDTDVMTSSAHAAVPKSCSVDSQLRAPSSTTSGKSPRSSGSSKGVDLDVSDREDADRTAVEPMLPSTTTTPPDPDQLLNSPATDNVDGQSTSDGGWKSAGSSRQLSCSGSTDQLSTADTTSTEGDNISTTTVDSPPVVNLVALADVNKNDKFSELLGEIEQIQKQLAAAGDHLQINLIEVQNDDQPLASVSPSPLTSARSPRRLTFDTSEEVRQCSPRALSPATVLQPTTVVEDASRPDTPLTGRPRNQSDSHISIQRSHSMLAACPSVTGDVVETCDKAEYTIQLPINYNLLDQLAMAGNGPVHLVQRQTSTPKIKTMSTTPETVTTNVIVPQASDGFDSSNGVLISTTLTHANVLSRSKRQIAYRFKHHTVNLLRDADNRLISTAVIRGHDSFSHNPEKTVPQHAPVVLGTAVIGRSTSAPRLQTLQSEGEKVPMAEIRRFWPPLRSLETIHDNLPFDTFVDFLKRVTTVRTPAPSPPKTPRDLSRENSDLNARRFRMLSPPKCTCFTGPGCNRKTKDKKDKTAPMHPCSSSAHSRSMTIDEEDETGNSQNWRLMSKTAKKLELLYSNYETFGKEPSPMKKKDKKDKKKSS